MKYKCKMCGNEFDSKSAECPRCQSEIFSLKNSDIELIAQERQRQIEVEGRTPKHDDSHIN
jgi:DNA-directed RNA polymerase subunit RPC12/RpoP